MRKNHAKKPAQQVQYLPLLRSALEMTGSLSTCYRRFHNYSFGNQLLLWSQFASRGQQPCPVATFKRWQELGRQVKKGSKAMCMIVPSLCKREVEEKDGTVTVVTFPIFFLRNYWFPVSDTEGETEVEEKLETPVFSLSRVLENLGIQRIDYTMINGNCQGYCERSTGNIAINPLAVHPDKTALHEIAHSLLHCGKDVDASEDIHDEAGFRECEAESTALIVGSVMGILSERERSESVGYIKTWMARVAGLDVDKLIEKSAKRIFSAVDRILKANSQVPGGDAGAVMV